MEIEMAMVHCANCGMPFAITKDKQDRLRECHNTFYCPAGHPQNYSAKTDKEILREKVASRDRIIAELEAAQQKRAADSRKRAALARKSKSKSKKSAPAKSG